MNAKLLLLLLLTIIFFIKNVVRKDHDALLSYLLTIALSQMSFQLFGIASKGTYMGQFGVIVSLSILSFLSLFILMIKGWGKGNGRPYLVMFFVVIIFVFISCINPNNIYKSSVLPPFFYFIQLIIFVYIIRTSYSNRQLYLSLYDAISCWVILEFILTICYPILNMQSVASLFHGEASEEWALRRDNYASAVGTFIHPGMLAFVCSIYMIFFVVSFFSNFRKWESFCYCFFNAIVIFFTFSRTSYVALLLSLIVVIILIKSNPSTIIIKTIKYGIGGGVLLYLLTLVPVINDLFFKSDASHMLDGRMMHYMMGWSLFRESPIWGLGINNHVYHMYNFFSMAGVVGQEIDFFVRSPIHNAHLIILVEMGVVGFSCWILGQILFIRNLYKKMFRNRKKIHMCPSVAIGIMVFNFVYGFFGWSMYNYSVLTVMLVVVSILWNNNYLVMRKVSSL